MAAPGGRGDGVTSRQGWTEAQVKESTLTQVLNQAIWFPRILAAAERYEVGGNTDQDAAGHEQRLRRLLEHAMTSVPAYRNLEGKRAATAEEMLAWFPIVDRGVLEQALVEHCMEQLDPARAMIAHTSGTTTGRPLRFVLSHEHLAETYGAAYARWGRAGIAAHSRTLRPCQEILQSWYEYTEPAHRHAHVAAFGVRNVSAEQRLLLAQKSVVFAPAVLTALPSQLLEFADLLEDSGLALPPVQTVQTYGELLTASVRERLAGFFGTSPVDGYGLREVSTVAAQCALGAYHVESPRMHVEVVGDDDSSLARGVTGEVVVTELVNLAMPLIRYRTGDLGRFANVDCPCGLPWPVLELVASRKDSGVFHLASGATVAFVNLVALLRPFAIERFQLVQRVATASQLRVTLLPGAGSDELRKLAVALEVGLGPEEVTGLTLVETRQFVVGSGGKHRELVSQIDVRGLGC